MQERDGHNLTTPAPYFGRANDVVDGPVPAFDENVRLAVKDAFDGGIFIKPGNHRDTFQ